MTTQRKRPRKPRKRQYAITFECPSCNGRTWGTSNCTSPFTHWIGHCHDEKQIGCRFSWPRKTNDKRVFVRRMVADYAK